MKGYVIHIEKSDWVNENSTLTIAPYEVIEIESWTIGDYSYTRIRKNNGSVHTFKLKTTNKHEKTIRNKTD